MTHIIEGQTMLDGTEDMTPVFPECHDCGKDIFAPATVVTVDGEKYCEECTDDCEDCRETVVADDMTSGPDGSMRCEDCHNEAFAFCQKCEEDAPADDMTTVTVVRRSSWRAEAQEWCESCVRDNAWECDGCNDAYAQDDQHANYMSCCNTYLCDSCAECSSYCESCEEYRCSDCAECECHNSEYVHDYNYRPTPVFHRATGEISNRQGAKPANYYFGVELELTGDYEMANAVIDGLQSGEETHWYCKEDGSVRGVEFVSHPHTLAAWQEYDIKAFMRTLVNAGAEGGNDGLHVHVSRTAFKSSNHFRRFSDLLTRGDDAKSLTEHVAGRTENNWAKFTGHPRKAVAGAHKCKNEYASAPGAVDAYGHRMPRGYFERYEVLNVTNRATVEFRLGCSTLDAMEFLAVVEYLAAAIEYTRGVNLEGEAWGALETDAFLSYLADNMSTYPNAFVRVMPYAASL